MTTPDEPMPPAWTEHSTELFYAARLLAEHELVDTLSQLGVQVTPMMQDVLRLAIAGTTTTTLRVLRTAGWVASEPSARYEDTVLPRVVDAGRERLEAWDNEPTLGLDL